MNEWFGIVTAENCYLRQTPGKNEEENESGIEDEIFSGWAVRRIGEAESEINGWIRIETHYGYQGYVRATELREISRAELQERQDQCRFRRIMVGEADLLDQPKVQGLPQELLLKNAIVEVLESGDALDCVQESDEPEADRAEGQESERNHVAAEQAKKAVPDGWTLVRTAAGREGYVHSLYLKERKDGDDYLLNTGVNAYFRARRSHMALDEGAFRRSLVQSAMEWIGTQYRWAGKSSQGIDCSGLLFMCYLENGVLIYRDAKIMPDYPMQEIIGEQLKPGDAIYFPGHVAMYLGDGKYIHSTAHAKTPWVTINSLNPCDEDYREDLARKIVAYGSIF